MSDSTRSAAQTLLVGISNPETAERLVQLAAGIADTTGGEILLTHVVTVASQISLTTGQSSPDVIRARDFVHDVIASARDTGIATRGLVEVARSVEDGLLAAAESHKTDTILVGYSDQEIDGRALDEQSFDRTMHRVARKAHAEVIVAKLRKASHSRVVVPVTRDIRLGLTGVLCRALTDESAGPPTFLHVVAKDTPAHEARLAVSARLDEAGLLERGRLEVLSSDAVVETLVDALRDYDLVILTPSDRPGLLDRVYSSRAEKIAEAVTASAILVWGSHANE